MRKWLPLVAVCLGSFMLLVDVTIVNVALPDMADDLKTSFSSLQWVVDAYALTLAALVLGTGSIADRVGHRKAYIAGLALFALASLVCGIAPGSGALIAARAVQGVGAAAMFATTFALLNSSYSGRDRGVAYGMWGAVVGASAAVGPILGGLLTQAISWRWIFFVNLPVSVVAILLCVLLLDDPHAPARNRIDWTGIVAFTASAAALTYGMIRANEHGWADTSSWGMLLAGGALLIVFVVVELRVASPMLDLGLLRNRAFTGMMIAGLLLPFSAFAYFTYTSIWLQSLLKLSPIQAGLTSLPLSIASFTVSAMIGKHLHHRSPGPIIGVGLLLIGGGALVPLIFLHGSAGWPALIPGFAVAGLGVGLATPTMSSATMAAVPAQRGGMAAGALNSMRQLGFAFGIALLGSVFASRAESAIRDHGVAQTGRLAHALAGGQSQYVLRAVPAAVRGRLDDALHAGAIAGLQGTFFVAGVAGLVAALAVFVLVRPSAQAAATGAPSTDNAETHEPSHAVAGDVVAEHAPDAHPARHDADAPPPDAVPAADVISR